MCSACTNYEKQDILIEKSFEKQAQINDPQIDLEQFKKSVVDKLNN